MTTATRLQGVIKRLCEERPGQRGGFGFIRTDEAKDWFFHNTELIDCTFKQLHVGDLMEFTPVKADKGPRANEVTRLRSNDLEQERDDREERGNRV